MRLHRHANRMLSVLAIVAVWGTRSAAGATLTVTDPGDNATPGQLRAAINAAAPGDTITFSLAPGTTITLDATIGPLLISRDLTISGPGPSNLFISGGGNTPVFDIHNPPYPPPPSPPVQITVNISGVTIENSLGVGVLNEPAIFTLQLV